MTRVRAHVIISGQVQGVWFRGSTQAQAAARGVTGWVRNRPDGTVEAVVEGAEEAVRALVDWCRRGPSGACVEKVEVTWEPYRGEFDRMIIARG
ncbi:MAG: acylphosphatase [Deltaproteobacteria bacterium RBG_13_65_10]|jgi:acylphosphatase|nr:MAG: acylphosphatase [Deltaproteobacteria bacterium RBG_13_65_10]